MAIKNHLLIFLSLAVVALSIANAQSFPGSNPVIGTARVIINGTLLCSLNGGSDVNGPATPPFPNALVQLRNRDRSTVSASAITGPNGVFTIDFRPSPLVLAGLLTGGSQLYVATPLVQCNSTLPSDRRLVSTGLRLLRDVDLNLLRITLRLVPEGFRLSDPV